MTTLNVQNRTLFHGDNLPFLRGINSGTIHLIATDPPFNKGRDFHATPDSLAAGARCEVSVGAEIGSVRCPGLGRLVANRSPAASGS